MRQLAPRKAKIYRRFILIQGFITFKPSTLIYSGSPKKESRTKVLFFLFLRLRRNRPTRALQIKHFIALICLSCTSLLARIWVRIPNEAIGELVLQWRVQVYSALLKFPYSTLKLDIILPRTANSRTKPRVARCPWDLLFCR